LGTSKANGWLKVGILVSGAIALFAKSAGAAPALNTTGTTFDPGNGLPRVKTQNRFKTASLSQAIDLYEWGPPAAPAARLIVASDDPTSFVAFVPASSGRVHTILARGSGPMTAELEAFVTREV
jgi:hypothetical protein